MNLGTKFAKPLAGARILVADDEFLIAMDVEATLLEAGAETVHACGTLAEAAEIATSGELDAAVLDIRLGHETTARVAGLLQQRGVPFVFYSGQPLPSHMQSRFFETSVVVKPVPPGVLVAAVLRLLATAAEPS